MDKTLIDTISSVTGATPSDIQARLQDLTVDQLYDLIDFANAGEVGKAQEIIGKLEPSSPASDSAADTSDIPDTVGSSEDTQQDAPQDAPKDDQGANDVSDADIDDAFGESANNSSNYVGKFMKSLKDYLGDDFKQPAKTVVQESTETIAPEAEVLEEGVLGMTQMPSIARMLALAGVPGGMDDNSVDEADDVIEPEIIDTITDEPEVIEPPMDAQIEVPVEVGGELADPIVPPEGAGNLTSIQVCRDSFESIRANLGHIKVSEFPEVRSLMSDLMSQIDRMSNSITGK